MAAQPARPSSAKDIVINCFIWVFSFVKALRRDRDENGRCCTVSSCSTAGEMLLVRDRASGLADVVLVGGKPREDGVELFLRLVLDQAGPLLQLAQEGFLLAFQQQQ